MAKVQTRALQSARTEVLEAQHERSGGHRQGAAPIQPPIRSSEVSCCVERHSRGPSMLPAEPVSGFLKFSGIDSNFVVLNSSRAITHRNTCEGDAHGRTDDNQIARRCESAMNGAAAPRRRSSPPTWSRRCLISRLTHLIEPGDQGRRRAPTMCLATVRSTIDSFHRQRRRPPPGLSRSATQNDESRRRCGRAAAAMMVSDSACCSPPGTGPGRAKSLKPADAMHCWPPCAELRGGKKVTSKIANDAVAGEVRRRPHRHHHEGRNSTRSSATTDKEIDGSSRFSGGQRQPCSSSANQVSAEPSSRDWLGGCSSRSCRSLRDQDPDQPGPVAIVLGAKYRGKLRSGSRPSSKR